MAFSRITITFNEDLVDDDNILYTSSSPFLDFGATWVLSRINSFEVMVDTPTVNVGEISAIKYKESFELDYNLSNFIITQVVNVITVTFRNETQVFTSGISNKDVDFVIDSVPSIPLENTTRINVRSPFFISAPIYTGSTTIVPDNVVFNVFVWSGDISSDKPTEPNYVINKDSRFLNDDKIYIDISKLAQDFIQHEYNGTLSYSCVFVAWNTITTYSEGELEENKTILAFDGYNNYFENVNYIPSNDLMISNKYISVKLGDTIHLPMYLGGDEYNIEFRNGTSIEDDANIIPINISNTNNAVFNASANAENVNNIRIENITQATEEILDVEIVEECIYEPIKCVFINSDGVQQEFWFYKANREDLRVTDETYQRNVLNESIVNNQVNLSYNTSSHKNKRYNTQGVKSITVNTGYIDQDNNILIEELLLSENIWLVINNVITPVDIQDKSVSYLTKTNDQLIKYTLKFGFSFNQVQNIR